LRADRLLSILMYLQTRGRTTTDRLALEFEVSRRTIIRDVYALRVAGFPVYTERGPHGGCYLHEEYRNTLTQLTSDEVAALFLSSIQQPLKDLGLSDPLRGAVLKLTAALPASRQAASSHVRRRIVIDSTPWSGRSEPIGHLGVLHQAAMEDRWVFVEFQRPFDVVTTRRIAPYGLVAKAGAWFVVWAGEDSRLRVDRLSKIREAQIDEARFERPEGFDVEVFWSEWRERQEKARPAFDVRLRVRKRALTHVRDALGERRGVFPDTENAADAWVEMDASFPFFEEARRDLLALGGAVEVIRPRALRASMADFAVQIGRRYADECALDGTEDAA
jgi:predicted DNA-binding transcriptional regulator YafY